MTRFQPPLPRPLRSTGSFLSIHSSALYMLFSLPSYFLVLFVQSWSSLTSGPMCEGYAIPNTSSALFLSIFLLSKSSFFSRALLSSESL